MQQLAFGSRNIRSLNNKVEKVFKEQNLHIRTLIKTWRENDNSFFYKETSNFRVHSARISSI